MPQVRLIGAEGEQLGIVEIADALKRAQDADLDLVEVAPGSKPPVTRLLDYSKYKYEQDQKQKQARKHQQQVNIREIKLRPKIANHDYETKKGHVERFLKHNDKVKVTIMFRGREQAHPERGRALLQRLFEDLGELAVIESAPLQEGRNMSMLLAPGKAAVKVEAEDGKATDSDGAAPASEAAVEPEAAAEVDAASAARRRRRYRLGGALGDDIGEPLGGVPVPERWRLARLIATIGQGGGDRRYRGGVEAEQGVGAGADRHRPLGVVAQGEAGDAEEGRLLLDPPGVGEDGAGVGGQREEVEVAERLGEQQAGALLVADLRLHHLAGPRVDREDDRHLRGEPPQLGDRLGEQRAVDEGGAVQGDEQVGAGLDAQPARRVSSPRKRPSSATSVSIIVLPTKCMRSSPTPSARRFSIASSLCRKSSSRERVGDDPVELLGHRAVEAAQAGLDVGDRDVQLGRRDRRRHRRVDVAGDDHEVGALGEQHRLEALHHPGRLLRVAARADLEHVVGRGHPELLEEDLRHQPVVVLAGVDDGVAGVRQTGAQGADHRGHLDQVRPGSEDVEDVHRGAQYPAFRPEPRGRNALTLARLLQ